MKFLFPLICTWFLLISLSGCKTPEIGPDSSEPLKIVQPASAEIKANAGEVIPIEIQIILDHAVDSLFGDYQLDEGPFVNVLEHAFSGNGNIETFNSSFTIPADRPDTVYVKFRFTVVDEKKNRFFKFFRIRPN